MDVPLWAFLLSTVLGPAVGAALTVLGSTINNRHTAREAERERKFQLLQGRSTWRSDQLNAVYEDALNTAEKLYALARDPDHDCLSDYEERESEWRRVGTRLRIHSTEEVHEAWKEFGQAYANYALRIAKENEFWAHEYGFSERLAALEKAIRKHLDELEQ